MLCRLLNTFQSTLDEVSIIALPTQHSIAATGPQGQAAAQRYVRLQSFYDPAKGKELLLYTHIYTQRWQPALPHSMPYSLFCC